MVNIYDELQVLRTEWFWAFAPVANPLRRSMPMA